MQSQQASASPKKRHHLLDNKMLLWWEKDPFQSVSHQTHSSCPPKLEGSAFPNPHISLATAAQAPPDFHDVRKKVLITQLWDVKINIYLLEQWHLSWWLKMYQASLVFHWKACFCRSQAICATLVWMFFSSFQGFWRAGSLPVAASLILQTGILLPLCSPSACITTWLP